MKIAIRGHESRGEKVIQILKSLGGKNIHELCGNGKDFVYHYHIDSCGIITFSSKYDLCNYKFYTLEEFEMQFPFKVGDKVIHKEYNSPFEIIKFDPENVYPYTINGPCEFSTKSCILTKWQPKMKKERNITLTLDKAKEWYKKGGELKEIALQAFTERELNPLPKSWEEFCKQGNPVASWRYAIPTKYEALYKLEQLRDCWWNGWKPDWNNDQQTKYCIVHSQEFKIHILYETRRFLSFPTIEMAKEFLECFRDLIEKTIDLI